MIRPAAAAAADRTEVPNPYLAARKAALYNAKYEGDPAFAVAPVTRLYNHDDAAYYDAQSMGGIYRARPAAAGYVAAVTYYATLAELARLAAEAQRALAAGAR